MPALEEPIYQVLRAQQANIARIASGLVVSGTGGNGGAVTLWGATPNIVRLYDRPLRFAQDAAKEGWERIITLLPVVNDGADRIVGRNDRRAQYQVQMLVRLTQQEVTADRQQVVIGGVVDDNPLAAKMHRLLYDFHHVFFDNHLLATDDCPNGLVDDAKYSLAWAADADYPMALVVATVLCEISAY